MALWVLTNDDYVMPPHFFLYDIWIIAINYVEVLDIWSMDNRLYFSDSFLSLK